MNFKRRKRKFRSTHTHNCYVDKTNQKRDWDDNYAHLNVRFKAKMDIRKALDITD